MSADSVTKHKTRYFNQARLVKAEDGSPGPGQSGQWHRVCHGHTDLNDAIQCDARARAFTGGTAKPRNKLEEILLGLQAETSKGYRDKGYRIDLGIAKADMTIIESPVVFTPVEPVEARHDPIIITPPPAGTEHTLH